MNLTHRALQLATEDRGAALVLFAVFAPVAILFAALAIDAGNWFLHKRHLQLQADAGVLATAQEFQGCFTNAGAANAAIDSAAERYSGSAGSPLYNQQLGGTLPSNVHVLVNSQHYYNQASQTDSTAVEKPPCEAEMVDLKVTETKLPWYWRAFSSVPFINAHARIEILQSSSAKGVEPLAVAETAPVAATAYFVDEDNKNAVIARASLEKVGVNAQGQDVWSNPSTPAAVLMNHAHVGVVIALSGNQSDTTCGHEYVECFGRKAEAEKATLESAEPALHIAAYPTSGAGTLAKPLVREQTLTPTTCTDGYFSTSGEGCKFAISAIVDYGSTKTQGVTVTPVVKGATGSALIPPKNAQTEPWTGSALLTAASGSNEISFKVACKAEAASPCPAKSTETTVKNVHRIFAAGTLHSGSLAAASIGVSGGTPQDANTFPECAACSPQKLVVTIAVEGSLSTATGYADPLRPLKFEGNHGVIVGCPPGIAGESASEFRAHLETGCPGTYKINASDPACTANAEPYDCLQVNANGKKKGALSGIGQRIESTPGTEFYCQNKWQNTNNGGIPLIPTNDSRIIQVFIMPYGSLDSTGKAVLPSGEVQIQNFAAFYVTGFPGDSCKSDPNTQGTEIVGHFMKYVNPLNGEGKEKCVANSLGECVAVLTR